MLSTLRLQARTKALFRSYSQDWGLVLVVLIGFHLIDQIEPFHRQFSVTDKTIQHPFAKQETVPNWMLGVVAFVVPAVMMSAIAILHKRSYTDLHNALLGLMLSQSLVLIVTDSIKIAVGRPRPDFLDRCLSIYDNMAAGTPLPLLSDPINMLSHSNICTRRDLLRDGFKAFPSGHSSFSFGGLGYLAMYLAGKLHLFDERGHIYKSFIVLTPVVGASLVAISRVVDYRHHWEDVTVGAFVGSVAAVFSYRQYYPSLAALRCDSPFKPRVTDGELMLPLDQPSPSRQRRRASGHFYRDDEDGEGDEGVDRGSVDATARGEVGSQFFRRDETDDTLADRNDDDAWLTRDQRPKNKYTRSSSMNGGGGSRTTTGNRTTFGQGGNYGNANASETRLLPV